MLLKRSKETFKLISARSSRTTQCAFCIKKRMKKQRLKVLLLEVQLLGSRKLNILVREVEQKYMTEVQGENNEKFNYCKECISGKNKSIEK